jgi:hypothetical protein
LGCTAISAKGLSGFRNPLPTGMGESKLAQNQISA